MDLTTEEKMLITKMCYQKIGWYESEIDKIENMPPNEETYFANKKYGFIASKNKLFKIINKLEVK